jgi:GNAT superfamily N-acetyltransferase
MPLDDDVSTIEMFLKDGASFVKMLDDSNKFVKTSFGEIKIYAADIGMHIVGYKNKELAGMAIATAVTDVINEHIKVIKVEYVTLPKFRRQGLAKKLAKVGAQCMTQWGIRMAKPFNLIEADVAPDNESSARVAKSLGLQLSRSYEHKGKKYLVYADMIEYKGDKLDS